MKSHVNSRLKEMSKTMPAELIAISIMEIVKTNMSDENFSMYMYVVEMWEYIERLRKEGVFSERKAIQVHTKIALHLEEVLFNTLNEN